MSLKHFLCLGAALLPLSAQALDLGGFDLTPEHVDNIADPAYRPAAGELDTDKSFSYSNTTEKAYAFNQGGAVGSTHFRDSSNSRSSGLSVTYGVTDRLSFGLSEDYVNTHIRSLGNGSDEGGITQGMTNPTLDGSYRLIDQSGADFNLDLKASYTPDLFPAKRATRENNGTIADGSNIGEAAVEISRQMKSLTLSATPYLDYLGKKSIKTADTQDTITYSAHWRFGLDLKSQLRLTDDIYLNAGGGIHQTMGDRVDSPADYQTSKQHYTPTKSFFLSPGYRFTPNLTLNAEYQRSFLGHSKEADQTNDPFFGNYSSDATWQGRTENLYALHLRYRFN